MIEFEDANRFESNGSNKIANDQFSGYSGSGYLYLVSGWGEVNFTVPADGEYKITIASNADSYKENWLYLDNDGAGALKTSGNKWQEDTYTFTLTKGTHKFGVSSSWGYTALDYVKVEAVSKRKHVFLPGIWCKVRAGTASGKYLMCSTGRTMVGTCRSIYCKPDS